ncbi:sensor histidine kinase [Actinokineospora pegani]|uniref:sensor histidine kinase n=1 Tax=Actinokineospora pegani TaxID=2654637 RepID=UPI0012E9E6DD|nr:histidine kinase [Actinokineospora pegani]
MSTVVARWFGWMAPACAPVALSAVIAREGRLAVWEAAALVVVFGVAVASARRWPGPVTVVSAGAWQLVYLSRVDVDSALGAVAAAGGVAVVAFLAGRHRVGSAPLAVAGTLGAVAGAVAGDVDTAIAVAAGTAVPWAVGHYRARYAEMVRMGWDQAERWERDADRAAERERARLAADVHDLVGHELARAALLVGSLEVSPTLAAGQRATVRQARAAVTAAAERLSDAVRLLRSEDREPVESVVGRARRSGVDVQVVQEWEGDRDPVVERTVHRVVTEGLTNAMKHAAGAPVRVRVRGAEAVEVVVTSGPARSTVGQGAGQGLAGLAERVALVGGEFSAGAAARGGFEVRAVLPVVAAIGDGVTRAAVERGVRDSARRTAGIVVGVCGGVLVCVLGYLVFDAASSVVRAEDFARLRVGQARAEVERVLPGRTRDRDDEPGCRSYGTHANPFDGQRADRYRLCFRGGTLVSKEVVRR